MEKSTFMVLDLIASGNWERPIYFNITSLNAISLQLKTHVLQEGQVYRLLPIQIKEGSIDTEKMYANLMEKSEFHDLQNEKVYYNHEDYMLRILQSNRSVYNELAADLLNNHKPDDAKKVIDFSWVNLYGKNKQPDLTSVNLTELLLNTGERENGEKLALEIYILANEALEAYSPRGQGQEQDYQLQLYTLRQLHEVCRQNDLPDLAQKCAEKFNQFYSELNGK
jgi:hypothetical protein